MEHTSKLSPILKFFCIFLQFLFYYNAHAKEYSELELTHPVIGCPENSICNQNSGNQFLKFKTIFEKKELHKKYQLSFKKFVRKNGLPLDHYIISNKPLLNNPSAIWKSKCIKHRNSKPEIFQGTSFFKKIDQNKIENNKEIISFMPLIIQDKTLHRYLIPLNSFPVKITKKYIQVGITLYDKSFNLTIYQNGQMKLQDFSEFPTSRQIFCPKQLVNNFIKLKNKVFKRYNCFLYHDLKTIFLLPLSC